LWAADPNATDLSTPPFAPAALPSKILVPFPFESSLSGLRVLPPHQHMWYRTSVTADAIAADRRVLLRFEAVDWFTQVYVNGALVGNHSGGYDDFAFDITSHLIAGSRTELVVGVFDPTDHGSQPHGKQSSAAFAMPGPSSKYTSTSTPSEIRTTS
jgi:beta-galactosidase/beta-glucuronidase